MACNTSIARKQARYASDTTSRSLELGTLYSHLEQKCIKIHTKTYPPPSLWPRCGRALGLDLFSCTRELEHSWGPGPSLAALTRLTFFRSFFDLFLGPHLFRFWSQLEPNLTPNLAQNFSHNRPKKGQNPKPTCITFSILFLLIFGASWVEFW